MMPRLFGTNWLHLYSLCVTIKSFFFQASSLTPGLGLVSRWVAKWGLLLLLPCIASTRFSTKSNNLCCSYHIRIKFKNLFFWSSTWFNQHNTLDHDNAACREDLCTAGPSLDPHNLRLFPFQRNSTRVPIDSLCYCWQLCAYMRTAWGTEWNIDIKTLKFKSTKIIPNNCKVATSCNFEELQNETSTVDRSHVCWVFVITHAFLGFFFKGSHAVSKPFFASSHCWINSDVTWQAMGLVEKFWEHYVPNWAWYKQNICIHAYLIQNMWGEGPPRNRGRLGVFHACPVHSAGMKQVYLVYFFKLKNEHNTCMPPSLFSSPLHQSSQTPCTCRSLGKMLKLSESRIAQYYLHNMACWFCKLWNLHTDSCSRCLTCFPSWGPKNLPISVWCLRHSLPRWQADQF